MVAKETISTAFEPEVESTSFSGRGAFDLHTEHALWLLRAVEFLITLPLFVAKSRTVLIGNKNV